MKLLTPVITLLGLILLESIPALKSTPIVNVTINIAAPFGVVDIPGRILAVVPFVNGTIKGNFNGEIQGGAAYARILNNGTFQTIEASLYGTDDQGGTSVINELGIESGTQEITRLVRRHTSREHNDPASTLSLLYF